MDIIRGFGPRVLGSSPGRRTKSKVKPHFYEVLLLEHKFLCVRELVRAGDMFFSPFLARKTVEAGEEVLRSVAT